MSRLRTGDTGRANVAFADMPAGCPTLAAIARVGAHGAGIAAFGSAIGLPVPLLVVLGTAGIASIIETA